MEGVTLFIGPGRCGTGAAGRGQECHHLAVDADVIETHECDRRAGFESFSGERYQVA